MTDAVIEERRLNRRQAAEFLEERGYTIAVATLEKYATLGGGPVFEKFGRKPLYKPSDLLSWVAARRTGPLRSTSDLQAA